MNRNILYTGILLGGLLAACSQENEILPDNGEEPGKILFSGAVLKHKNVETRAGYYEDPDADNYEYLNTDGENFGTFYIWEACDQDNYFVPYIQASGERGALIVDTDGEWTDLEWYDRTSDHTFYAWTQPETVLTMDNEITQYGKQNSGKDEEYHGTVKYGSIGGFEHFVVTSKGPVSYEGLGKDVALFFDRPISKISLKSLYRINTDGSEISLDNCTIEFPNFPAEATFYPFKFERGGSRYLVASSEKKGIIWAWDKDNDPVVYVHPFSFGPPTGSEADDANGEKDGIIDIEDDLGFFILTNGGKSYCGTLNSFSLKKLDAGECLQLALRISDGSEPTVGIGCTVIDWSTKNKETISQYRKPGVYTQEDAEKLLRALKAAEGNAGTLKSLIPDLIAEEESTIRINLFTHIVWEESGELNIPENWILDGNGYNLSYEGSFSGSGTVEDLYQNGEEYEYPSNPDSAGQEVTEG